MRYMVVALLFSIYAVSAHAEIVIDQTTPACDKTSVAKKEVSSDSTKALEARIAALENEVKKRNNEKLAKEVFEAKAQELSKKFANYTSTTNQWIDEKFGAQDADINKAMSNSRIAVDKSATAAADATKAKADAKAALDNTSNVWSAIKWLVAGFVILLVLIVITASVLHRHKQHPIQANHTP